MSMLPTPEEELETARFAAESAERVGVALAADNAKLLGRIAELEGQTQLRPVVRWFAEQMELKLRENDHKGGWHEDEPQSLVDRIRDELEELESEAVEYERPASAIAEAADVAAMAMMVADHFREGGPSQDQGRTL